MSALKSALLKSLKSSIKSCLERREEAHQHAISDNESSKLLCSCIEAIFLHGKLDKTNKVSRLFKSKSKQPTATDLDYWDVLKEFLPPHMIEIITSSAPSRTSIGCCRVWVRASLNEGTVENYVSSLLTEKQKLKKFYQDDAFLRDGEMTMAVLGLLKALETIQFDMSISSMELNNWSDSTALRLAGFSTTSGQISATTIDSTVLLTPAATYSPSIQSNSPTDYAQFAEEDEVAVEMDVPDNQVTLPASVINAITDLDEAEVLSFVNPDFDNILNRSIREKRSSSVTASIHSSSVGRSRCSTGVSSDHLPPISILSMTPSIHSLNNTIDTDITAQLEASFLLETENFLRKKPNQILSEKQHVVEKVESVASSVKSTAISDQDFIDQTETVNNAINDTDFDSPQTTLSPPPPQQEELIEEQETANEKQQQQEEEQEQEETRFRLPSGSNSLSAQRYQNSWWSAPDNENNVHSKTIVTTTHSDGLVSDVEVQPVQRTNSYGDAWKNTIPHLVDTYQKLASQGLPVGSIFDTEDSQSLNQTYQGDAIDSEEAGPSWYSITKYNLHEGLDMLPGHDSDSDVVHQVDFIPENHTDDSVSSELDINSDNLNDWQLLGDDMLTEMSLEKTRLLEIFPGVKCFDENCKSVFGGNCSLCKTLLSPTNWQLDYYDGRLYCIACSMGEKCIIPRDVIHNWDFTVKPVSHMSKVVIMDLMFHPNISITQQNPLLYEAVPTLKRVCHLRRQLCMLWYQVTLCDAIVTAQIREHFLQQPYMLSSIQEIHLYSLDDLKLVRSGALEKHLSHAINSIALPHVKHCRNCRKHSMKCELCLRTEKPIYLYEIDSYVQCITPNCSRIMHSACVKKTKEKSATIICRVCQNLMNSGIQPQYSVDGYDQYRTLSPQATLQNRHAVL